MRKISLSDILWYLCPQAYANHLRAQGQRDFEAYQRRFPAGCANDCQKRADHIAALGNKPSLDANDVAILKGAFLYAHGYPRSSDAEVLALYRTVGRHPRVADAKMIASLTHAAREQPFPRFTEHHAAAKQALASIGTTRQQSGSGTAIADVYIAPA